MPRSPQIQGTAPFLKSRSKTIFWVGWRAPKVKVEVKHRKFSGWLEKTEGSPWIPFFSADPRPGGAELRLRRFEAGPPANPRALDKSRVGRQRRSPLQAEGPASRLRGLVNLIRFCLRRTMKPSISVRHPKACCPCSLWMAVLNHPKWVSCVCVCVCVCTCVCVCVCVYVVCLLS